MGATLLVGALAACGGGGGGVDVEIAILLPSATGAHTQSAAEVRLGGTVSRAGYVEVRRADGDTVPGYVTYFDGQGTWMADVYGLRVGPNTLDVVADNDGTGRHTATARIVVTRTPP